MSAHNIPNEVVSGDRKLLQLAAILDGVKAPEYDQHRWRHSCGTPACALGHWAVANPHRWKFEGHWPQLTDTSYGPLGSATADFALDEKLDDACELFGGSGCGHARTAQEAAEYIRQFVARRSPIGVGFAYFRARTLSALDQVSK